MVMIDWKNCNSEPVYAAYANIVPFDADGQELGSGVKDYPVFFSETPASFVNAGETYIEPEGEGFVLLSNAFGKATRVDVEITKLLSAQGTIEKS